MKTLVTRTVVLASSLMMASAAFAVGEVDQTVGDQIGNWLNEIGAFKTLFFAVFALAGIGFTGFGVVQMINSQDPRKAQENKASVGLMQTIGGVTLISLAVLIMMLSGSVFNQDTEANEALYQDNYRDFN